MRKFNSAPLFCLKSFPPIAAVSPCPSAHSTGTNSLGGITQWRAASQANLHASLWAARGRGALKLDAVAGVKGQCGLKSKKCCESGGAGAEAGDRVCSALVSNKCHFRGQTLLPLLPKATCCGSEGQDDSLHFSRRGEVSVKLSQTGQLGCGIVLGSQEENNNTRAKGQSEARLEVPDQ